MADELDIDKTVDGIVEDILPPSDEPDDRPDPPDPETPDPETPDPETPDPETPDPEDPKPPKKNEKVVQLKPGDPGYVEPKQAPKSWSKEIAPEFSKLPPAVQDYIHKREEDFTAGISQYKQAANYAQAVHSVLQPYAAHVAAKGINMGQHLKYLMNADYVLSTGTQQQKAEFLSQIMEQSGITKEMLGETPQRDPATLELEKKVAETNSRLTEYERQRLDQARAEVAKAVDTFAADPKNIYFKELEDDIVKFIEAGYTLQDAYDKAVWANPSTRAKEMARTSKEAEEKAKKARAEAALKAKRLNKSNVKDTPSDRKAPTSLLGSMDDTLRDTLRNINERSN